MRRRCDAQRFCQPSSSPASLRPVATIINTHTHPDHVGSNGFFPASVEIVAHENTRASMAGMEELKGTPSALPDRTYKDRLTLGRGADQIDLYYFGAGHTNGDTLVVFTAARTMHTGDLFPWKALPLIDTSSGGSGVAYPATIERAVKGIRNVDSVITATWAPCSGGPTLSSTASSTASS